MPVVINLKSSDGEVFTVDVEVAKVSKTIKTMLEHCGSGTDEEERENEPDCIPVSSVKGCILRKVIEWINYHLELSPSPSAAELEDVTSWHRWFFDVDQATLFGVVQAANYLDIEYLLDLSTKEVARMIEGRTTEELRKLFHIENDFTPEEEQELKKKFEFCSNL